MIIKNSSWRGPLKSVIIMLYFVALVAHNIYDIKILDLIWDILIILCFSFGVFKRNIKITKGFSIFLFVFLFSGLLNILFVGNIGFSDLVFLLLYAGIYQLLIDDEWNENFLLAAIYINCIIILYNINKSGLGSQVFGDLSINFISVFMFLPITVYYIRVEYYKKRILLLPAFAVTLTCFFGVGRSGIITSAFLFFCILWYVIFSNKNWNNAKIRAIFRISILFVGIGIVGGLFYYASRLLYSINQLQSNAIFQRFAKYGMYGTGRLGMWEEYIMTMMEENATKNILFGVNYSKLSLMVRYKNNLHNSFFNLHADYGIGVILYIFYMFIFNCIKCIKGKRWIYLSVMIVFFIRAFMDRLFWGGSAAISVLIFVLLQIRDKKKKRHIFMGAS